MLWKNPKIRWLLAALLGVAVACAAACSARRPVALIDELQGQEDYFTRLQRATQKRKVYADLDIRLYIHVTYLSATLLKSYMREYAHAYGLSPNEQRTFRAKTLEEYADHEAFFVSIFAPGRGWDKLDTSDEIWRLRVRFGDLSSEEIRPDRIVNKSVKDPKVHYFYPFVRRWSRSYLVMVPGKNAGGAVHFSMDGVIANELFTWSSDR